MKMYVSYIVRSASNKAVDVILQFRDTVTSLADELIAGNDECVKEAEMGRIK